MYERLSSRRRAERRLINICLAASCFLLAPVASPDTGLSTGTDSADAELSTEAASADVMRAAEPSGGGDTDTGSAIGDAETRPEDAEAAGGTGRCQGRFPGTEWSATHSTSYPNCIGHPLDC